MSKYSKTIYFCATLILCILEAAILNLITSVLPSSSGCLAMPGCAGSAAQSSWLPSNCQGVALGSLTSSGVQSCLKHPSSPGKPGGSISSC